MNKTDEIFITQSDSELRQEQVWLEAGIAVQNLSHFLKNLLQMVGGGAETARAAVQSDNPKYLEKSLDLLLPNLERLKRTIIDLCEYSRIRPLQAAPCDLKILLEEAQNDLPAALKEKGPALRLQTDPTLPFAYLDPDKIRWMFRHILIFLIDQKSESLSAEIQCLPSESRWVISFTWEGILPENPQILLEPVEQKGTRWGTGLDLPLAARIIHQHNGCITMAQKGGKNLLEVHLPQQAF